MKSTGIDLRLALILGVGLLAFAFAPILVRWAGDVNPIALAAWRTVFAVVLISPFYAIYNKQHPVLVESLSRSNLFWLKVLSGLCLGLHFTLWVMSLKYTSVASASVLVTIHPILLIVAEQLIFKVRFGKWVWAGVVVSFFGSLLLGFSDSFSGSEQFPNALLGDLLAFLAAVVFAIYFLISRKVRQHTTWIGYVSPIYAWSAVTCVVMVIVLPGEIVLPEKALWMALGLAVAPQLMGHGAMNYAVKYVSPTILSTTILVEPTLATLFGMYFFSEYPSFIGLSAMLIIISGVFLTWFGNTRAAK